MWKIYVTLCIYIYIGVYIYTYIHIYTYIYIYVYTYVSYLWINGAYMVRHIDLYSHYNGLYGVYVCVYKGNDQACE